MKLQQLRCIYEVVQNQFNISRAAESIHTSQPGVSKQIQLFEEEIGVHAISKEMEKDFLVCLSQVSEYMNQLLRSCVK